VDLVILEQDVVEFRWGRIAEDAEDNAAVVLVARLSRNVMDQAVAYDEVLVGSSVSRGDEDTHSFRARCRLVDELEILDGPAAGIADIDDAHALGVRTNHGARITGRSKIGDPYDRIRPNAAAPERERTVISLSTFEQDFVAAIVDTLFCGVVIGLGSNPEYRR